MRNKKPYSLGDVLGKIIMNRELSIKKFQKIGLDFTSLPLIFARMALLIVQFNWRTRRARCEDVQNTFTNRVRVGDE